METVIIPKEKYLELGDLTLVAGFTGKIKKHIYNIIAEYRDQKVMYGIDFETFLDDDGKEEFERFGIYTNLRRMVRNLEKRNYLLIIDHSVGPENAREAAREFVGNYLPEGAVPTHFVVNKTMESYSEMVSWNNAIREIYPDILSLTSNAALIREKDREQAVSEMKEELEAEGIPYIEIGGLLGAISQAYNNFNTGTINAVRLMEEQVLDKWSGREVLVCSSAQRENLGVIAAYLFYKHGITPQLNYGDTSTYLANLSKLLFDRNRMLVEDQINYLKNLPDVMLRFNEGFEFFTLIDKKETTCRIRLSCLDMNKGEDAPVEKFLLDLNKVSVIPLLYEYPLKGNDGQGIKPVHDGLLTVFKTLERKLGKYDSTVNVTNTFFMEHAGVKYVAHVDAIDLRLFALVYPEHNELVPVFTQMGIENVSSLYPVNVLPAYSLPVKEFINKVRNTRPDYEFTSLAVYKHNHAIGLLVSYFNNKGQHLLKVDKGVDFVTLGLWWEETYKYRIFLLKDLSQHIDLQEFRKSRFGNHLSIFGGPHPSLNEEFNVTEEFLKE
jgi:hypothetical protein